MALRAKSAPRTIHRKPNPPDNRWLTVRVVSRTPFIFRKIHRGVRFTMKPLDDIYTGCERLWISFFTHERNEATGETDTIGVLRDFANACGLSYGEFDNHYDWHNHSTLVGKELEVKGQLCKHTYNLQVQTPNPANEFQTFWRACKQSARDRKWREKQSRGKSKSDFEKIDFEKVLGITKPDEKSKDKLTDWD